jgi:hypothetical protein
MVDQHFEEIKGYRILKRLGAGNFGETFLAERKKDGVNFINFIT